jgi:acyl-[acyl-carrier-protein] desaturase
MHGFATFSLAASTSLYVPAGAPALHSSQAYEAVEAYEAYPQAYPQLVIPKTNFLQPSSERAERQDDWTVVIAFLLAGLGGFAWAARPRLAMLAVEPSSRPKVEHSVDLTAPAAKGPIAIVDEKERKLAYHAEVMEGLEPWVDDFAFKYLKTVEDSWQPMDFVPDPTQESFLEEVHDMREVAKGLSNETLVGLVGDTVTEEALPTYLTMLNTFRGTKDLDGSGMNAWNRWSRIWTGEENRHGDLLNRYLYLTGRVDMRQVEVTIQHLIGQGMRPFIEQDPYKGFIYTSFQERATKISHGNVAFIAGKEGDQRLQRICGVIAADEGRHEKGYQAIVQKCFEIDPNGTMIAFAEMMKSGITMPAHLMTDGLDRSSKLVSPIETQLFTDFAAVAEAEGVYTAFDYCDILDHLLKFWKIKDVPGLNSAGQEAQEFVLGFGPRLRKLSERRAAKQRKNFQAKKFSWVHDAEVGTKHVLLK